MAVQESIGVDMYYAHGCGWGVEPVLKFHVLLLSVSTITTTKTVIAMYRNCVNVASLVGGVYGVQCFCVRCILSAIDMVL